MTIFSATAQTLAGFIQSKVAESTVTAEDVAYLGKALMYIRGDNSSDHTHGAGDIISLDAVPTSRVLNTSGVLTGGGSLSADRTLALANQGQNTVLARTEAGVGPVSAVATPMIGVITAADAPAARDALGAAPAVHGHTAGEVADFAGAVDARITTFGAVPAGRSLNTSGVLTGGGSLSEDRTLALAHQGQNTVLARTEAGVGPVSAIATPMIGVITAADAPAARDALGAAATSHGHAAGEVTGLADAVDARITTFGAVPAGRSLNTSGVLTGGGSLSEDRTLALAHQGQNTVLARTEAGVGPVSAIATPMIGVITAADAPAARDALGAAATSHGHAAGEVTGLADAVDARIAAANLSGALTFQDDGVAQGSATTVNVVGTGASLAVTGGVATLTVPDTAAAKANANLSNVADADFAAKATAAGVGGSLAVSDEGLPLGTATTLNVVGSGASLAVANNVATLTIPGGGGGGVSAQSTAPVYLTVNASTSVTGIAVLDVLELSAGPTLNLTTFTTEANYDQADPAVTDITGGKVTLAIAEEGGIDSHTRLLLHGDGSLTDSSGTGKTVTADGTASINTNWSKFGTGSLRLPGPASTSGQSRYIVDASTDIDFDTDFTLDFWMRPDTAQNDQSLAGQLISGAYKWTFAYGPSWIAGMGGKLALVINHGEQSVPQILSWNWVSSAETAYHIALVRRGNDFNVAVDGTFIGWKAFSGGALNTKGAPLHLGCDPENYRMFQGYFDEVRWSNTARWLENFTPRTSPYGTTVYAAGPGLVRTLDASRLDVRALKFVHSLAVPASEPAGTRLRYAISTDNRQTWISKASGSWQAVTNTPAGVDADGMTAAQFQAAMVDMDVSAIDTIDVALALKTTNPAVTPEAGPITVTRGVYLTLARGTDYAVTYDTDGPIVVKRLKAGSANHLIKYV